MLRFTALVSDFERSAKNLAGLGLALLRNRLELLSIELREEGLRVVGIFIWSALSLLFALLTLVVGTFTVVYLLPPERRGLALLIFLGAYLVLGLVSFLVLKIKIKKATTPFSQTIAELKKDRECF